MAYTICKFKNDTAAGTSDNFGLADDRYLNQNFEERVLFNIDLCSNRIINLGDPVNDSDAVSKKYITILETRITGLENVDLALQNADLALQNADLALQNNDATLGNQISTLQANDVNLTNQISTLQTADLALQNADLALQNNDVNLTNQISTLQASDLVLQSNDVTLGNQISTLQDNNAALNNQISSLQNTDLALQNTDLALQNSNITHNTRITSLEGITQQHTDRIEEIIADADNIRGNIEINNTQITAINNTIASLGGQNYFMARFDKQVLDYYTEMTTWAWCYFTSYEAYQTTGDIECITTQFEGQVGIKIGSTSAKGVYFLNGSVRTTSGMPTVRLMCHSPGNFNYEIKRWKYDVGAVSDSLRFPITSILFVAKGYELYFQYYRASMFEHCEDIEFSLFPLTATLAV